MKSLLTYCFCLSLGLCLLLCCSAALVAAAEQQVQAQQEQAQQDAKSKDAGQVKFTSIQDLDPDKKALNRPIRQKWAVVIGINKFKDRRLSSSELNYAKTARRFYDYLRDPQAGRFRADHIRLLTDDQGSLQSIYNSFGNSWLGKLAEPDDLVVVYIATRSFPTTDGNTYLCPYNCAMDNIYGSCISLQELMKLLREKLRSERIVLVLESPYSGSAELDEKAKSKLTHFNFDPEKLRLGKGLIILSSSKADQLSWSDLFTDNLIAALREKNGLVPLEEAFVKSRQKTEYDSLNRQFAAARQTPVMKSSWQGNDLVIGANAVEANVGLPDSVSSFLGAEAHYLNANRAVQAGDLSQAVKHYEEALAEDPSLADARADYAVTLGLQGNWQQAESQMRQAIALNEQDPLYLSNYARILDKLGEKDEAKKVLQKAYLLNPKDKTILLALTDKATLSGDFDMSMRLLDQALVLYPDDALVQDRMCFLLSRQGRNKEAISHARKALQLDPTLEVAALKLGALLEIEGEYKAAINTYQKVLEKNSRNADAHFLLAQCLEKDGAPDRALLEFARFMELSSSSDSRRPIAEARMKALENKVPRSN